VHAELFSSAVSQWNDFLMVGGAMIGLRVLHSDSSVTTRYFHSDNLGSIAVITDESGNVVERDSYDAWGKRRYPTGADDPSGSIESQTTRGFTGQEELADVGLVHLNGRVYDPLVGRMTSADPMVPDPLNGQAWNRYSYVINNPLAFTDPNGYSWLSTFLDRSFGVLFRKFPILGALFEIFEVGLCVETVGLTCTVPAAFASTTFVAGVTSGNLGYALRAGLIAGATAAAFSGVGALSQDLGGAAGDLLGVAGRALIGCASAAASGGKCGPGALAGGITALAGRFINGQNFAANVVSNAVLGGAAAVAGGGKFANGAVTGAFGYLFSPQAGIEGAYGAGNEEENGRRGLLGEFLDPTAELRVEAFYNAYNQLRGVAPDDPYATFVSTRDWVPSMQDVNQIIDRLSIYTSPLTLLHPEDTITSGSGSYGYWSGQSNETIIGSLRPGQDEPLTVGVGGVVWQGNTRIMVLQDRGVDVNTLPRVPYPRY
jgi:RHS repeat-associated protein